MCCFMQNFLARTLADFEMKLEKEVLVPLNKLSEVAFFLLSNHMNWNWQYSWPIHDRCYLCRRTCQRSWKTRNSLLNLQQTGIMLASGEFLIFDNNVSQTSLSTLITTSLQSSFMKIYLCHEQFCNVCPLHALSLLDLRPAQAHRLSRTD